MRGGTALIGVALGVIAWVSPPETLTYPTRFYVFISAGVVFVVGFVIAVKEEFNRRQRKVALEKLSLFIKEGQQLKSRLGENPLPIQDHNDWVDRVDEHLEREFGNEYVTRFSNFSGMVFYGNASERSKMERSIDGRLRRLHEFISELEDN
jgi:hypothetical protein